MYKNLIIVFLSISILFFGCSKANRSDIGPSNNNPDTSKLPVSTIKLSLISGDEQTDTIGNPLSNPIIVKATKDGVPAFGYTVKFVASGCGRTDTISTPSQEDGTVIYEWSLAGDIGQQSLKAYVLNSNNLKVDSVTATATGLSTSPGWHRSGCSLQGSGSAVSFCKLSTGRLFTCFLGKTYLRYSDDNGVSWNALKSMGNKYTIMKIVSSPTDELFAFTMENNSAYYSNDEGQTWSNLGTTPFNIETVSSVVCTASGKLIATASSISTPYRSPPVSISLDKGKSWTTVPNSSFVPTNNNNPLFNDPSEDNNGNLYVVEQQNGIVFKSTDIGQNWTLMTQPGNSAPKSVFSFYIDKNNWFYESTSQSNPGVFISKDNSKTYNQLIFFPFADGIENMSIQSDGNFYYEDIGIGLYTNDGNSPKLLFAYGGSFVQPYIVAKNNNVIFANEGQKYIRYFTK